MILLNGRGQLGSELSKFVNDDKIEIYHTWNFIDKSFLTQHAEYLKLKSYLKNRYNKNNKFVFIGTTSKDKNSYTFFKREASKLVTKLDNYLVIDLPNLIGKGILHKLIHTNEYYEGVINFTTKEKAAKFIINNIHQYSNKLIECPSEPISISNLKAIIEFVKNES